VLAFQRFHGVQLQPAIFQKSGFFPLTLVTNELRNAKGQHMAHLPLVVPHLMHLGVYIDAWSEHAHGNNIAFQTYAISQHSIRVYCLAPLSNFGSMAHNTKSAGLK